MKHIKDILKESIFGALLTLWTAPIDKGKLDISQVKSEKKKAAPNWGLDTFGFYW